MQLKMVVVQTRTITRNTFHIWCSYTRVVDLIQALKRYGMEPQVVDPWVDYAEAKREYGLEVMPEVPLGEDYQAVVAAVAHHQFQAMTLEQWLQLIGSDGVLMDLKGVVPRKLDALRL